MKYLSVKQAAEKWGISGTMVRRYCKEGRIPKAILKDSGWKIPDTAKKPKSENEPPEKKKELPPLAKKLIHQKTKKNYHGLYDYVMINLTYSSCRMASNRLTRKHVESIFKKGKVSDMFEPMKVSDMIEVMNHCVCLDYIIDHLSEPLNAKNINNYHHMLTYGTVDARLKRVTPSEFRTASSKREEAFIGPVGSISKNLKALTDNYEAKSEVSLMDILEFHVQFERIFPFEDYNGRVGRLIMFKECLRHNVMPFVLDDKRRTRYLEGLREWDNDSSILAEVVMEAQSRFDAQIQLQKLSEHRQNFLPVDFMED